MANDSKSPNKISPIPGMAILGCFAVGCIGVFHSLTSNQAGLSLLASAVAFGAIVIACFKT